MDKKHIEWADALKMENGEIVKVDCPKNIVVDSPNISVSTGYTQFFGRTTAPNYQQIPKEDFSGTRRLSNTLFHEMYIDTSSLKITTPKCCLLGMSGGMCKHKIKDSFTYIKLGTYRPKYSIGARADSSMETYKPYSIMITMPKRRPAKNDQESINQLFKFVTVDELGDMPKNFRQTFFKEKICLEEKQMYKLVFHYVVGEPYTARQVKNYNLGKSHIIYSKTTVKGGITTDSTHKVSLEDVGVLEMHCGDTRTIWKNPAFEKKFSIKVEKVVLNKTPKTSQKEKKVNPRKRKTEVAKKEV